MGWLQDETGLEKCAANYAPLTPLSHLRRAAELFAQRDAIVYGAERCSYADYHARVSRLASGLGGRGVAPGDVVATLLPNVPAHAEAHFGVPACGAVLNAINMRLEVDTVQFILGHGGARVLLADAAVLDVAEAACAGLETPPVLIEVPDLQAGLPASGKHTTYEQLLAEGDPAFDWIMPADEWESIALNYTSGTTGRPKGVVCHHRGAYLSTLSQPISWRMTLFPRYLTIVPMFHCNAWCHPWMLPALGGAMICLRDVTAAGIYDAIAMRARPIWVARPSCCKPSSMPRRRSVNLSTISSGFYSRCAAARRDAGCDRTPRLRRDAGIRTDRNLRSRHRMPVA